MEKGNILEVKALDKESILDYLENANENEMSSAINLIHFTNSLSGKYEVGKGEKRGIRLKPLFRGDYETSIEAEFIPGSPVKEGIAISVKDKDGRYMKGRFSIMTDFTGHHKYYFNK